MSIRRGTKGWCVFAIFGVLAIVVLLMSVQANAQVTGATLTGTVTDPSGAFIPNARISITNTATGVTTNVTSNAAGIYTAPNLIPGPYKVSTSAQGFKTVNQTGITLTVGAIQDLNVAMTLGAASETVNVNAEATKVELTSSSISDVVGETTVRELPLNGRDWTTLATLQPGVQSLNSIQSGASVTSFSRGNRGLGFQMSVSGSRPQLNNYRIDGITVNDYTGGGPGSVQGGALGVDAIQEFSVLTSNYTAEYGRGAGGVINAISRSGTNTFHGTAFEFLRNSALDARNFFDPAVIPPFKQNQFGADGGFPIRKDKTFFFADYEGLRVRRSQTVIANVPSPDARNGILNFSPDSTFPTGCVATSTPNQCQLTVDPRVTPYLALWSLPNGTLYGPLNNTGPYSFAGKSSTTENFYTGRFDNKFSDKDSMFSSMEYDHSTLTLPDQTNDIQNLTISTRVLIAVEETHIFTPQFGNTLRAGYSRSFAEAAPSIAVNPAAGDLSLGPATGKGTPNIQVSGLSLAEGAYGIELYFYPLNSFQVYDDAFLTKGKHDLKFGFALERDQLNTLFLPGPAGTFQFSSLVNLLTDVPRSLRTGALNPGRKGWRQTIVGAYVQDNFRMRSNLTLNLGVRYEMSTVPSEVHGHEVSLHSPSDLAPVTGPPLMSNPTLRNFAPRVGFAWDPFRNGKTSVRGSFGIFDILPLLSAVTFADNQSQPYNVQGNNSSLIPGDFPVNAFNSAKAKSQLRTVYIEQHPKRDYAMTWNLNVERQITPTLNLFVGYLGSHGVHEPFAVDDMNMVLPTMTSIGWLWPYPYGSGSTINSATGTTVSRIDARMWSNSTTFHALEAQLSKTLSHGIGFQASYTWSKAIDDGDGIMIGDPFSNSISTLYWFDPKMRHSVADFDIKHNLTLHYFWDIPKPASFQGPAAAILGGWRLGGIVTVRSGLPFTLAMSGSGNGAAGDPLGQLNSDSFDFPSRVAGSGCGSLVNPGSVNNYIKLNCLGLPTAPLSFAAQCVPFPGATTLPPAGQVYCANRPGDVGRNALIGPGLINFDFSVFKNNYIKRISETFNVQFRAEMFNVFNHANFNPPIDNSNVFDATGAPIPATGVIDGTSTFNREIQFGLKFIW